VAGTAAKGTLRRLRVGLNLVYLVRNSGGAGTYARELLRAMLEEEPETEVTAFVSSEVPDDVIEARWPGHVDFVRFPITVTHGPPGNFALTMGSQWGAVPLLAARRRLEVVHGLANITPLVAPGVATVVTLLDLIWIHYPQTMDRRATVGMKMVAPVSARRADRVIAISHAAADDLVRTLGLPRAKIDVTPLGIRPHDPRADPEPEAQLRAELGLGDDPVVLCVAQKREHKNLLGLIRALALARDTRARLVLPGSPTPHEAELRQAAAELGVGDRVVFPEWLSPAGLEGLYRLARCFVLPSFEEGFGLPILEAMARDVPVACSNCSSLPEVAGDAALLFDPRSPEQIAAAIDRLLVDEELRGTLVERGRVRCEQFAWRATARATLASYRRAISDRRARRSRSPWRARRRRSNRAARPS
jgi:glycosyltransferase involved in cell wall biosynthesis